MIRFACPVCSVAMEVPDQKGGEKIACLKCGQKVRIPSQTNKTLLGVMLPPVTPPTPSTIASPAYHASPLPQPPPSPTPPPQPPAAAPPVPKPLTCPHCRGPVTVAEEACLHTVACPLCQGQFVVPRLATSPTDGSASPRPRKVEEPYPRLIQSGALILCPHCDKRLRISRQDFNVELLCPSCDGAFKTVVGEEGYIPFDCPDCRYPMEIAERLAGQSVRCPDCGAEQTVPTLPLFVRRLGKRPAGRDEPPPASTTSFARGVLAGLFSSARSGPRCCIICGRHIRNSSSYCYKCKPSWLR
jgi:uncharacterized protein YbaR (Trm112 family)